MTRRIEEIKSKVEKIKKKKRVPKQNFNIGFKISLDLISPIIAGILIGIGFDNFFSTKPIFFLIFLLLGIIAGFYNIIKSMNKLK